MKLQLKYKSTTQHAPSALLIKGEDPNIWLQTINSWQVKVQNLECYLLPASKGDIRAVGLVVIFAGILPKWEDAAVVSAYGQVSERLLVPVDAALVPAIEAEELEQQLLYDRQLFHPRIGLIGFNKSDQVTIASLLQFPEEDITDWGQAAEGISKIPALRSIQMPPIPPKELIASLKQDIGSKPIEDIPGVTKEKEEPGKDLKDMFKKAALKGGMGMAGAMLNAFSSENGTRDPVLFNRFMDWAGKQLENLNNKRNQEMDRLVDMFDGDIDEALKYAIPLDSAYQNRGQAPPSSNLSERSTDFSLDKLGGGGQGDAWSSGRHYFSLRGKYIEAAKQKIAEGDFRKAAYIYAHLLGDFRAAANVLEQGGFYREAAALHIEHLKDKPAAAKCLEKGGLLYEAVDLYKELNKHEKVGDLYSQLEQIEEAEKSYGKAISESLLRKDYLDASRILSEKLADIPKAKKVLLDGWKQTNKSEVCLKRYFDLTEVSELATEVQSVYQHHTFPQHKNHFLNVLLYLKDQKEAPQLENISRELAYQIIGKQVNTGNTNRLADLPKFVPTDKLLSTDINRYTAKKQQQKTTAHEPDIYLFRRIILDRNVVWEKTSTYNNQFLVLGTSSGKLHFARGNSLGDKNHHSWSATLPAYTNFQFVEEEQANGPVLFYSTGQIDLESTIIPKSSSFPADLRLNYLNWLPEDIRGLAKVAENEIGVLAADKVGNAQLYFYDNNGFLKYSMPCMMGAEGLSLYNTLIGSFFYRKGYFYFITKNNGQVLRVNKDGKTVLYWDHSSPARMLAVTNKNLRLKIAISTERGIKIIQTKELSSPYFGQGIKPSAMAFIPRLGLVVTKRDQVFIFDDKVHTQHTPSMLHSFKTGRSAIISIVPLTGSKCGFLTNDGELLVYAFK